MAYFDNNQAVQAFYYSKSPRENNFKSIEKYFRHREDFSLGECSISTYYSNTDIVLKNENGFIFNLGVLIYENKLNIEALKIIADELRSGTGLSDIMKNTSGIFCLAIKTGDELCIATDKAGHYAVFKYENEGRIELSNIRTAVSMNNSVTANPSAIINSVTRGSEDHIRNMLNEVEQLPGGRIYRIRDNSIQEESYYNIFENLQTNRYRSTSETNKELKRIVYDRFEFLKEIKDIHMDLSGGFDTRTILSFLLDMGLDFHCGIGDFRTELRHWAGPQDAVISSELADKFDLKLDIFTEKDLVVPIEEVKEIVSYLFPFLGGEQQNGIAAVFSYKWGQRGDISLIGLYGTELLNKYHTEKSDNKLDLAEYTKTFYPFADILKEDSVTKEEYYEEQYQNFKRILESVSYNKVEDLDAIFTYLWKTIGGRPETLYNMVLPVYSIYLDPEFIRIILQSKKSIKYDYKIQRNIISELNLKLSRIRSSTVYHLYPPTRITPFNFYKFGQIYKDSIYRTMKSTVPVQIRKKFREYISPKPNVEAKDYLARELSEYENIDNEFYSSPIFKIISPEKFIGYLKSNNWGHFKKKTKINCVKAMNRFYTEVDAI